MDPFGFFLAFLAMYWINNRMTSWKLNSSDQQDAGRRIVFIGRKNKKIPGNQKHTKSWFKHKHTNINLNAILD